MYDYLGSSSTVRGLLVLYLIVHVGALLAIIESPFYYSFLMMNFSSNGLIALYCVLHYGTGVPFIVLLPTSTSRYLYHQISKPDVPY
eukprot:COSAG02_NODE_450_length_22075_cov_13.896888_4_plen_87_part_00